MTTTFIGFRVSMRRYKLLKALALQETKGDISEFIRRRLPDEPEKPSHERYYEVIK